MVRSQNNKYVDNYHFLASIYDSLLQDEKAYDFWLEYIEKYIKGKDVLELASGSGVMAKILNNKGYNILASDISVDMQNAAKANFDGEYQIIDMRNFNLNRQFDLVLCICDSINYLADTNEFKSLVECVYNHLNKGGVFIFDSHHYERLNEFKDLYIEEGNIDDIDYQWTIQSENNEIHEHFAFYVNDTVIEESHTQTVFQYDELIDIMQNIGFKVTFVENFIENEKVLFIGEKI